MAHFQTARRRRRPQSYRVIAGSGAVEPSASSPQQGPPRHPSQNQQQGPGGQQASPFYDLSTDPILNAIRAQNQQMIANAEAAANANRERLLLQYGDPELAKQFGGDTLGKAAADNPFSIMKQLRYGYDQSVGQANEALNKSNLFFSSTRGQELGNLARAFEQGQSQAGQSLQEALSGISAGVLDVKNQAGQRETDALNQAYQHALDFALQYGIGPKGNGGSKRRRRRQHA